ncbi:NfeD family protein [Hydrogenophaga sp. 5NK40-0174]|uniref:NfeD family protein n=1 Tax=Hydrogenophaga sp. 5NK40-0174 TaxID=3127649 RepID=UPI003103E077
MSDATLWWVLAGGLVALELATGTFYLLMLALGAVAGALAAHMGLSVTGQIATAGILGFFFTVGLHQWRKRHEDKSPATASPDVNLDIGSTVHVTTWQADGTARVHYRGAQWLAVARNTPEPQPGIYKVVELEGSRLVVEKT